ncbi:hypothetical protein Tam10B_0236 [Bifidobacterium vansinderenii]|uniref:Uncharacterized protein n=1 Tax=Bifidobacterium vansinderenii TaxID=1984871 RepID=A0A229W086_9BIFI|nr:hypothetical protein Tam10B_0236 [Bifidobacterium vansinderenii]
MIPRGASVLWHGVIRGGVVTREHKRDPGASVSNPGVSWLICFHIAFPSVIGRAVSSVGLSIFSYRRASLPGHPPRGLTYPFICFSFSSFAAPHAVRIIHSFSSRCVDGFPVLLSVPLSSFAASSRVPEDRKTNHPWTQIEHVIMFDFPWLIISNLRFQYSTSSQISNQKTQCFQRFIEHSPDIEKRSTPIANVRRFAHRSPYFSHFLSSISTPSQSGDGMLIREGTVMFESPETSIHLDLLECTSPIMYDPS